MVPDGGVVLANINGTAPGLWIEHGDQVVVLLPGPPRELGPMLEGDVRQRLSARVSGEGLFTRVVRSLRPERIPHRRSRAAVLRAVGRRRSSDRGHDTCRARRHRSPPDRACARPGRAPPPCSIPPCARRWPRWATTSTATTGHAIEQVIGDLLRERGWHLAAAESCTGGLLMARLTEMPGSSDYVACGVVSYSNQSKVDLLGVDPALIDDARRRERAGRASHGGGHPRAQRRRGRHRDHGDCRAGRGHRGQAGGHGRHCPRHASRRAGSHAANAGRARPDTGDGRSRARSTCCAGC